jgi:hypothetical protein
MESTTQENQNKEVKEVKKMKPIEIPDIELNESTSEEVKVDYLYKCMLKEKVDEENAKLDMKELKKEFKAHDIDATAYTKALKYLKENKTNAEMEKAELIETYMIAIKNNDEGLFQGLDKKMNAKIEQQEMIKDNIKGVEDKIGEHGLDKKALKKDSTQFIKDNNPNKKPPKDTIKEDGFLNDFRETLNQIKVEVTPLPINKIV